MSQEASQAQPEVIAKVEVGPYGFKAFKDDPMVRVFKDRKPWAQVGSCSEAWVALMNEVSASKRREVRLYDILRSVCFVLKEQKVELPKPLQDTLTKTHGYYGEKA